MRRFIVALIVVLAAGGLLGYFLYVGRAKQPEAPFIPTPPEVVSLMLKMAHVGPKDVVYDLGCGDGRIVIAAAQQFGARAVGIDLDPKCLALAKAKAQQAGVSHRVRFLLGDVKQARYQDATVVTLYLVESLNLFLRPELCRQLRPGARLVSHAFDMGDWRPDLTVRHPKARLQRVHLWIIPARAGGRWRWVTPLGKQRLQVTLTLEQDFQLVRPSLTAQGPLSLAALGAALHGQRLVLEAASRWQGRPLKVRYEGTIAGDRIRGRQVWSGGPLQGTHPWAAQREKVDPAGTWQVQLTAPWLPPQPAQLIIRVASDGTVQARWTCGSTQQLLHEFYCWGASLRFEVPLPDGQTALFRGFVQGDRMRGSVRQPGTNQQAVWSATRLAPLAKPLPAHAAP
jgi:SAM-dependent methyltransferase